MTDNKGYDSTTGTPPPYQQNAYSEPPPPYSPYPGNQAQPQIVKVSRSVFHNGARFADPSRPTIPPPAPGYLPNEVQRLAMTGSKVVLDNNKR